MKSLKPFLLVLTGVLITVGLFSFKNEESKKEYCRMSYDSYTRSAIEITYADRVDKIEIEKGNNSKMIAISQLNKMVSEGWTIISTTSFTGGTQVTNYYDVIYFERTQQ